MTDDTSKEDVNSAEGINADLASLANRYPFDDIGIVARSQECMPLKTPSFAINAPILVNITH